MLTKTLEKVTAKNFEIEVFGLGYVGLPLAIRLSTAGFKVRGIDTNNERVERLTQKTLMESEISLKNEFLECIKQENLSFSDKSKKINLPKIGIICVPTPIPNENIKSDIYVESAIRDFLNSCNKHDLIIIESSIEIGTTEKMKDLIEQNGFKIGEDFGLCFCPERIDPQNKKWNLANIPRVIYCSDDTSFQITKKIYKHVNNSNLIRVKSPKVAEVVKSFENTFRLINISLVNELAILCDNLGIDVKEIIDAAATKPFGFMPFYSGAGAGGHCIPKDPLFLLNSSKKYDSDFQTISQALKTNQYVPKYIANSIKKNLTEMKLPLSALVCGMSYKPDIEDMRDSPGFKVVKELIDSGFKTAIYDPFFKKELLPKYIIENKLEKQDFEILENIDDSLIENFSCLCIVQHHHKMKTRLEEIYHNNTIPLIYDCQNKLEKSSTSKSILKSLGGDNKKQT